ncbi:Transcriptional regulator KdgR [Roseibaca ekhonensis]|jgi:DNA-binding IclR family transcriptional regulator|uniref:Transcriptional regulator KdgR n=1 Tax=Roseinatronobacter ekhonensis TaxID=254356 RepID=A0A3B0MP25_9RHOB|nr:IclR family transcriptional regulator [Roseibaca ekhonensis]SUZ32757.1 Transcriptional regulator KdgR [Roseibaca ekhonensis]
MTATAGDGTVAKALDVLDLVAGFGHPVRFSDLLDHSPYPKATLYRLLQTLVAQRMLSFDADRSTYTMGLRLVRLAHAAWEQSALAPIARPHLDDLSAKVGETVHLAQMDHAQVLYVDKRNARDPIPMYSQAGKVGPAYCTGVGKAMLAYLPEADLPGILSQQSWHPFTAKTITSAAAMAQDLATTRARGFAFDNEEHEPGIICVAVPILSSGGAVLGALSVTSTTARTNLSALADLAPLISSIARTIGQETTDWRFPEQAVQPNRKRA